MSSSTILGVHSVSVSTDDPAQLGERLGRLGLVDAEAGSGVHATGRGAIVVRASSSGENPRSGILGVTLTGTPSAVVRDAAIGTPIEVVDAAVPANPSAGIARIESIPWATWSAKAAADALERAIGIAPDARYSGLVFPDVATTNQLVMLGSSSYIDFNEPTEARAPIRKTLESSGNRAYAVVLEARDFDRHVEHLRQVDIPTVTSQPVELRVRWLDGSEGVAARIVAVDRAVLHGLRVFVSEPTFPW